MKKLTILVALTLVVALAVPTYAASFSDVPADHWAYEAVNEIAAAGIIEGYSDGTFKGDNNITRYEIAIVVSRMLDNIAEERAALAVEVDSAKSNLSTGEAQDVTAIVKSLMEKNMPEGQVSSDSLTDQQAEQVANMIKALTVEFEPELEEIGAKVDNIQADMDELQATVNELKKDIPQDNVEFSGSVTTVAQVGNYGDDPSATAEALADGDALDIDLPRGDGDPSSISGDSDGDYDDFPAEEAFYQEIDLNVNGSVKDVNFDLAVDTITNGFRDYDGYNYDGYSKVLGDQGNDNDIVMDTALLTVEKNDYVIKAGDRDDYDVDSNAYFYDDEDAEGVEFTGPVYGLDVRAFAMGYDDGSGDDEYYGVLGTKDFGKTQITGKVYQGRVDVATNETVTDIAVKVDSALTDALNISGEAVYNELDDAGTDDNMFTLNADYSYTDKLSFRAGYEMVGEEFNGGAKYYTGVQSDLEEDYDYDKATLGTSYAVDNNNTVSFDATMVTYDGDNKIYNGSTLNDVTPDEDKMSYALGWDNTTGKFNNFASVSFVENDYYTDVVDDDATVIELGTDYAWTEKTKLSASVVNKSADLYDNEGIWDQDMEYTYLKAGVDHKLSDNISWITDVQYITGDVDQLNDLNGNDIVDNYNSSRSADIDGSFITTKLSVSF